LKGLRAQSIDQFLEKKLDLGLTKERFRGQIAASREGEYAKVVLGKEGLDVRWAK
jgi:hypothetical protein